MRIMRIRHLTKVSVTIVTLMASLVATAADQPNVLWIDIDDQSPWYSTYGDKLVQTPNIDALAAEGVVFEKAYVAAPVCSPSRSAMITGNYPIRIGAHDHRSGRVPDYQIHLPEGTKTVPELFRAAGYETYNASKDDYNFTYNRTDLYSIGGDRPDVTKGKTKAAMSGKGSGKNSATAASKSMSKAAAAKDSATSKKPAGKTQPALARGDQSWKGPSGAGDWRNVSKGKAFFGQMSIAGGKGIGIIETQLRNLGIEPVDPANVRIPLQYPDIPQVRQHVTTHYNSVLRTDYQVGQVVQRLKDDGLWGNTIIILYSDHGSDLPRSKEFVYEEGLHVPLIIAAPGMKGLVAPGRRGDIVNLMDVAATSLALAGFDVPEMMDAKNMFAKDYAREYVFSSADRMSNIIDRVRSVIGPEFHYIRNFMLDRPLYNWGHREMIAARYDANKDKTSFMAMRKMAEEGKLSGAQAAPYGKRVAEELYDLQADPDEVINLAADPKYNKQLDKMRAALKGWMKDTDDKGQYPRSQAAMDEITGRYPENWLLSPEFK
jgi:N-sulfoglucosamine sulfohydrolase